MAELYRDYFDIDDYPAVRHCRCGAGAVPAVEAPERHQTLRREDQ